MDILNNIEIDTLQNVKILMTILLIVILILSIICPVETEAALKNDDSTSAVNAKRSSKGLAVVAIISGISNLVLCYYL
jgi:hypothetical protein